MVSAETVLRVALVVSQVSAQLVKLDLKLILMEHVEEVVQMLILML